ncbi:hypothetical protein BCR44DRAFT_1217342 [Catenaria anguillulae PL171]|uniref:CAP-Gly domain-containing protein n=1 Tax=Catenaria anguillulae PL171 TaxID=765915 RepID=A0A1Y2HZ40_9FUNG|nr:hypothetical protein BCR44DRAFT_1217342 [Catenaria anguillulae PL171]
MSLSSEAPLVINPGAQFHLEVAGDRASCGLYRVESLLKSLQSIVSTAALSVTVHRLTPFAYSSYIDLQAKSMLQEQAADLRTRDHVVLEQSAASGTQLIPDLGQWFMERFFVDVLSVPTRPVADFESAAANDWAQYTHDSNRPVVSLSMVVDGEPAGVLMLELNPNYPLALQSLGTLFSAPPGHGYLHSKVHYVVRDGWVQLSDVSTPLPSDPAFSAVPTLPHTSRGQLSMVRPDHTGSDGLPHNLLTGPHTSPPGQLFLTLGHLPDFDAHYIVVGTLIDGYAVLKRIEELPVNKDTNQAVAECKVAAIAVLGGHQLLTPPPSQTQDYSSMPLPASASVSSEHSGLPQLPTIPESPANSASPTSPPNSRALARSSSAVTTSASPLGTSLAVPNDTAHFSTATSGTGGETPTTERRSPFGGRVTDSTEAATRPNLASPPPPTLVLPTSNSTASNNADATSPLPTPTPVRRSTTPRRTSEQASDVSSVVSWSSNAPALPVTPEHSTTNNSLASGYTGARPLQLGDRVSIPLGPVMVSGVLRFIGTTQFKPGTPWAGVELDVKGSGKNDGSVLGVKYFTCPPNSGIFVPLDKVTPEMAQVAAVLEAVNAGRDAPQPSSLGLTLSLRASASVESNGAGDKSPRTRSRSGSTNVTSANGFLTALNASAFAASGSASAATSGHKRSGSTKSPNPLFHAPTPANSIQNLRDVDSAAKPTIAAVKNNPGSTTSSANGSPRSQLKRPSVTGLKSPTTVKTAGIAASAAARLRGTSSEVSSPQASPVARTHSPTSAVSSNTPSKSTTPASRKLSVPGTISAIRAPSPRSALRAPSPNALRISPPTLPTTVAAPPKTAPATTTRMSVPSVSSSASKKDESSPRVRTKRSMSTISTTSAPASTSSRGPRSTTASSTTSTTNTTATTATVSRRPASAVTPRKTTTPSSTAADRRASSAASATSTGATQATARTPTRSKSISSRPTTPSATPSQSHATKPTIPSTPPTQLAKQHQALTKEHKQLSSEHLHLVAEHDRLTAHHADLERHISQLQDQLAAAQQEYVRATSESSAQLADLRSQLDQAQTAKQAVDQELEALRARVTQAEAECQYLHTELQLMEQQKMTPDEVTQMLADMDSLTMDLHKATSRIQEVEAQAKDLADRLGAAEQARSEAVAKLRASERARDAQFTEMEKLQATITDLQQHVGAGGQEKHEQEYMRLVQDRKKMETSYENKIASLESAIKTANEQAEAARAEAEALQRGLDAEREKLMEDVKKEREAALAQVAEERAQVAAGHEAKVVELEAQVRAKESDARDWEHKYLGASVDLAAKVKVLDALQVEVNELREAKAKLAVSLDDLREKFASAVDISSTMEEDLAKAEEQRRQIEEAARLELERTVAESQAKIEHYKMAVQAEADLTEQFRKRAEAAEAKAEEYRKKAEEAPPVPAPSEPDHAAAVAAATEEVGRRQREADEYAARATQVRAEVDQLTAQLNDTRKSAEQEATRLAQLREELNAETARANAQKMAGLEHMLRMEQMNREQAEAEARLESARSTATAEAARVDGLRAAAQELEARVAEYRQVAQQQSELAEQYRKAMEENRAALERAELESKNRRSADEIVLGDLAQHIKSDMDRIEEYRRTVETEAQRAESSRLASQEQETRLSQVRRELDDQLARLELLRREADEQERLSANATKFRLEGSSGVGPAYVANGSSNGAGGIRTSPSTPSVAAMMHASPSVGHESMGRDRFAIDDFRGRLARSTATTATTSPNVTAGRRPSAQPYSGQ